MEKKIGIMGGTFNPIHLGHLLLAEQAKEILELDEVLFMPSGNSYMKEPTAILDGDVRAHMVELAIKGHPYFRLSKMETERSGSTYTCDTLKALKAENPRNTYYFILGADSLLMLENWKNPEQIFRDAVIVASVRGTGNEEKIRKIAEHLTDTYQAQIRVLPARFIDLSSSEIRGRIKTGKSVRYMLPERVWEYICDNHLYEIKSYGEN